MRRNRRRQVRMRFVPRIFVVAAMMAIGYAVIYVVADSKCKRLGQEIGRYERKHSALENERIHEAAKWDEKKTPEKLARAMLQHGLEMSYPTAEQVLRVDHAGRPLPNQVALTRLQRLSSADPMVNVRGR